MTFEKPSTTSKQFVRLAWVVNVEAGATESCMYIRKEGMGWIVRTAGEGKVRLRQSLIDRRCG